MKEAINSSTMCILFDNYFFSLFILTIITKTNTGGRLLYFEYKKQ